ncbi:MAG: hypothetical protein M1813_000196 [Trichoglossum hirsutum]|nr:MAG: hypothetical protein M1813_000196 [Trichoglossum hirsutum]
MNVDAPIPTTPIFASKSLKLSSTFTRFVTIVLMGTALALLFLPRKSSSRQTNPIPLSKNVNFDYFQHFEGHQDCGIVSTEIYEPPTGEFRYCKSRAALLEALTGGGRHGFDTPFFPNGNGVFSYSLPPSGTQRAIALALRSSLYPGTTSPANITPGCHYRWFTTAEICMILERFDAIIFLGDNMVRSIYSAFNILLRENAALGALKQWEMSDAERSACRCDNQFAKGECAMKGPGGYAGTNIRLTPAQARDTLTTP